MQSELSESTTKLSESTNGMCEKSAVYALMDGNNKTNQYNYLVLSEDGSYIHCLTKSIHKAKYAYISASIHNRLRRVLLIEIAEEYYDIVGAHILNHLYKDNINKLQTNEYIKVLARSRPYGKYDKRNPFLQPANDTLISHL